MPHINAVDGASESCFSDFSACGCLDDSTDIEINDTEANDTESNGTDVGDNENDVKDGPKIEIIGHSVNVKKACNCGMAERTPLIPDQCTGHETPRSVRARSSPSHGSSKGPSVLGEMSKVFPECAHAQRGGLPTPICGGISQVDQGGIVVRPEYIEFLQNAVLLE